MTGKVHIKRAYEAPSDKDGQRILVDRLWPRGLARDKAHIDHWAREIAPSDALRRWFGHDPAKWDEFGRRYREELRGNAEALSALRARIGDRTTTLLYAAHDTEHNNAVILAAILSESA